MTSTFLIAASLLALLVLLPLLLCAVFSVHQRAVSISIDKALLEHLPDAALIFDGRDRLVDLNPAARQLLQTPQTPSKGMLLERVFAGWSFQPADLLPADPIEMDVVHNSRFYLLTSSPITRPINSGRLILIRDITLNKQAENEVRTAYNQSQKRADSLAILKEVAEILNQTLPPDQALEAGLEKLAQQVGASAAWLLTLTADQKVELSAGYHLPPNMELAREVGRPWALCACMKETLNNQLNLPRMFQCERLARTPGIDEASKYHLSIPVGASGIPVGILNLVFPPERVFAESETRLLSALGDQFGGAIERARLFKEVHYLAITDSLTGLYNRRHFGALAIKELERSRRYQHTLSLAILDIDHFKDINDTFGHLAGDQALQEVTRLCREITRRVDLLGRFGGEEILILMPETIPAQAQKAMERLREQIENLQVSTPRGMLQLTASIGVTHLNAGEEIEYTRFLDRADQALYQAKNAGRNQVSVL